MVKSAKFFLSVVARGRVHRVGILYSGNYPARRISSDSSSSSSVAIKESGTDRNVSKGAAFIERVKPFDVAKAAQDSRDASRRFFLSPTTYQIFSESPSASSRDAFPCIFFPDFKRLPSSFRAAMPPRISGSSPDFEKITIYHYLISSRDVSSCFRHLVKFSACVKDF